MDHHEQPKAPRDPSGYLESMTRIVFSSGMSWRVVEAKWPGIRAAFKDFVPERVARMTPRDVDRLAKDTRVIRNVPKLEATVANAKEVVAIAKQPGGIRRYLKSLGSASEAAAALRKRFRYLGDHGSYYFLWSVGEDVPPWNEWSGTSSSTRTAAKVRPAKAARASAKPKAAAVKTRVGARRKAAR
jgi:3-methyladenine DNA glycosylase Tag